MSPHEPIRAVVVGASGRMGRESLRALVPSHGFEVVGAVSRSHSGVSLRELAGGEASESVRTVANLEEAMQDARVDVVLDLSHHSSVLDHVQIAFQNRAHIVIGCTGLSDPMLEEIADLAKANGLGAMYVPNFAIGAVLMMKFSEMAAKWLPDVEIVEMHHDRKEDAPSGTAMLTAQLVSQARTSQPTPLPSPQLKVEGARGGVHKDVPVHSLRLPGFLAHQQVYFGGPGETLSVKHDSTDRISFMNGVRLALREVEKRPGLTIGLDKLLF